MKRIMACLTIMVSVAFISGCNSQANIHANIAKFQQDAYELSDEIRYVGLSPNYSEIYIYVYSDYLDRDYDQLCDSVAMFAYENELREDNVYTINIYDVHESLAQDEAAFKCAKTYSI